MAAAPRYPSTVPADWHAPKTWLRQAICIHEHEGAFNSIGYVKGVATYAGGFQFMLDTWHSVGGVALDLTDITRASKREQLYRAWLVWARDGRSWREWGTASKCGLR